MGHIYLQFLLLTAGPMWACARISICNATLWCFDGIPTHTDAPATRGLFMNSRMIQGIFDDANASTAVEWAYPDGAPFSAMRQTAEFAGNMSAYAACGMDGFTVGMQGGGPLHATPGDQPNESSGFAVDGTPLGSYLSRLKSVLDAAAAAQLIPIVSLFYQGQIERIAGDAAISTAVDAMVDWLMAGGYGGGRVLLEIANEVGYTNFPPSLQPDTVHVLISRAQARSGGSLLVSTSFEGGVVPPDSAIAAGDYVTIHCNGETPAEAEAHVQSVRASAAYTAHPKPIVFNECGVNLDVMDAAIGQHAGWGFYSQGSPGYVVGFQTPPTNWNMTASNITSGFFAQLAKVTGRESTCAATVARQPGPR